MNSFDSEPAVLSESSENEADEWNSDDSGGDSSDVSDWTAEAGIKFINESQRKRRRRKLSNHDNGDSSEEEYGEEDDEVGGGGEGPGPSKRAECRKERNTLEVTRGPLPARKSESKPKKKCMVSARL